MNFKHSKNLHPSSDNISKIQSIAWSPNNMRIAVAQSDKRIALYDENGEKRETFSTKPLKNKNYLIREIIFSSDSQKLAVALSDNIVYIYKLGSSWADVKKICNKFEQTSTVTCMIWPKNKPNELFIGISDGKVKSCALKSNSSSVLYSTDSFVVSLAASPDGKFLLSGHVDGVIYKFNFDNSNLQKMIVHTCIPYCLTWGNDIIAAGNDYKVIFYNDIGTKLQTYDYSTDDKLKEFTVIRISPNGDTVALGNHNKFFIYLFNAKKQIWEEACIKNIEGMNIITALSWKPDGSGILIGNITGSVDIFEACLKKTKFKEKFEITYVTNSQLVIKNIDDNKRLVIKPLLSTDILKLNIYLDNFIVMSTKESIVLGDLEGEKCSELPWNVTGKEKFDFNNPNVCMIYSSGELALIEYGKNDILGYCRTEYIHSNLISVRISTSVSMGKPQSIKIIAYLIDLNTIYIQDLQTQTLITNLFHDSKIDFLELNKNGTKLIFRDRKRHLYLYNLSENKKVTLLNFCGYVQWVPNSEVLVAQERKNVFVWYNIDDTDKVKLIPVKGEVEEVRRREGKTEVIVEEGASSQTYLLDDGLIAFSTAVDDKDLNKAVRILENLEMNTETETHWKTLAKLAISCKNLMIAQRCYAAIGSYSKANYIKKVMKISEKSGVENPLVEAKLLILDKQFNNAENLLLQNNLLDEAMEILNELQKWDESVKLAEKYNHPDINGIKAQYYNWLISNDQLDRAAELKEREGDFMTAINLYIKGGYPAKAANLVKSYDLNKFDNNTLENIIQNLNQLGIHEKAGELLEIMGHYQRSLESYQQARCYSKAVEIARKYLPNRVERLEEEWGDYLLSQKHIEAAIVHFIEANSKEKAIEASIQARKWEKAIELCNTVSFDISRSFFVDIGNHFANQRQLDTAEKYYIKAQEPVHAFNMYVMAGKWDKAEMIIKKYMKDEEFSKIIANQAMRYEQEGKYKEAERLYIMAGEHDIAISMYKTAKQYDNMIRLVGKYRPDFLKSTHNMVAQYLEHDKNLKQAEYHYIESGNWKSCVEMYKSHNMWEESLRVAKSFGSKGELNEISKKWVANMQKDQAIKMLLSVNLGEAAIDILCDNKDYESAFKLADQYAKYKLPDVHFKYAMECEDEKRYQEAEEHYIRANLVQEVIQMYEHIHEYNSALRVARQHDPGCIPSIYMSQGKYLLSKKDYVKAEMCFVYAKQPEYMVDIYEQENNISAALTFASKHCPHLEAALRNQKLINDQKPADQMTSKEIMETAKLLEESKDYHRAIETYLEINEKHFDDINRLEEIWDRAVHLAWEFNKNKANEITSRVATKLRKVGKVAEAADLYERIGNVEDAVECYISTNMFDRAKAVISTLKPGDVKSKLYTMVERIERERKVSDGNIPWLLKAGDEKGLELLFQQGKYEECLESAGQYYAPEILNKYLILIVKKFLADKNLAGAAEFLAKNNTPIYKNNLDLYKVLALEILAEENMEELKALKDMLYSVVKQLPDYSEFQTEFKYLSRLHKISYYQFIKFNIKPKKNNFPKTFYRVCLSVLSFGDIIKLDLALLDAGLICREIGLKGNAFILLNRYIDYYELIEDSSTKLDEENEFKDTEINNTPDAFRSENNLINQSAKQELHDWIVKTSIDKSVVKSLNRRPCAKCGTNIFEANTLCKNCNFSYECCVISGYPIHSVTEAVGCTNCGKKALKECWKEWITNFEQCPWCKSIQMSY